MAYREPTPRIIVIAIWLCSCSAMAPPALPPSGSPPLCLSDWQRRRPTVLLTHDNLVTFAISQI